MGLTAAEVAAWVERSCEAQGVPVRVRDRLVIARVATLMSERGAAGRQPGGEEPRESEAPNRSDPSRIEGPRSRVAGADDGVVEHGGDDGSLAGQIERPPLAS